jgi:arylsulfatase A-like enzyme
LPTSSLRRVGSLLLAACLGLPGCSDRVEDTRPNVILISVDTLRADALGVGGSAVPTPTFDRLASEGTVFEWALAPTSLTAPSHASLFTGLGPLRHGLRKNGQVLADDLDTLAERFRARGYATGAFVSSFVLDPRFGWAQGFDDYDATFSVAGATIPKELGMPGQFFHKHDFDGFDRRAQPTTERALAWLADVEEPYFLFVHYIDPHDPYRPPEGYEDALLEYGFDVTGRSAPSARKPKRLERLIRRYHAEIVYADEWLGRLLAGRPSARRRWTVLTADHGEGLGQHDWLFHAEHLHDELLHVPLIVHDSTGVGRGLRFATPVGLVDLAPTLAELANLGPPSHEESGRSFASSLRHGTEPDARAMFAHRRSYPTNPVQNRGEHHSVRHAGWKLIQREGAGYELYDLTTDPAELVNVVEAHEERASELRRLLEGKLAEAAPRRASAPEFSDEVKAGLEALGYVD